MNLRIVTVGKLQAPYLKEGVLEYCRRIKHYCSLEIIEVSAQEIPPKFSPAQKEKILEEEAKKLLKKTKPSDFIFALDIDGKKQDSIQFSDQMLSLQQEGRKELVFFIGGALGLAPKLLKKANMQLSLSPFTFAHELALVVLLEQIYRAHTIIKKEPYHK